MPMPKNVTVNIGVVKCLPFPKAMYSQASKLIVFMEGSTKDFRGKGTVIGYTHVIGKTAFGEYREDWELPEFEDFHGTITIEF